MRISYLDDIRIATQYTYVKRYLSIVGVVDKALDMGCGYGLMTQLIHANEIVTLDQHKQNDGLPNFIEHDLEQPMPFFKDWEFDLIVATDVVEHVHNDKDLFKEIDRILKPKGYLVFSSPYGEYAELDNEGNHHKTYDMEHLKELFKIANLEILEKEYTHCYFSKLAENLIVEKNRMISRYLIMRLAALDGLITDKSNWSPYQITMLTRKKP